MRNVLLVECHLVQKATMLFMNSEYLPSKSYMYQVR